MYHAQIYTKTHINYKWIDAQDLTKENISQFLDNIDGIIIPGGFGNRGIDGKIVAAQYARENNIPFFGICLGMQIAIIEFARHVLDMIDAHSTEFATTSHPVIDLMESQKMIQNKGGTMRLGAQLCRLNTNSKAFELYKQEIISERHRHRFEFNSQYVPLFEKAGFAVSGVHETYNLPEIIEIPDHNYFIGCQFHPELQSKPFAPNPLFVGLIEAALLQNFKINFAKKDIGILKAN